MRRSYNTRVGSRYGSRVITAFLDRDTDGHQRVSWRCDCGNKGEGGLKSIRHTLHCFGCKPWPETSRNTRQHGQTANGVHTRLYTAWANMKARVSGKGNPANKRWYFDKGITMCDEWYDFETFAAWSKANGFKEWLPLSLDRINAAGNYEPGNCQWITRSENSRRASVEMHKRLARANRSQIEVLREAQQRISALPDAASACAELERMIAELGS